VSRHAFRAALAALALAVAAPAAAHETLHEIARGKAVAVKAYFADGEVLAYTAYEVYSPADPKIPYQKGRTDRGGWLAFVPDAPGKWRVKVIDDTGHGLDLEVDAADPATAGQAAQSGSASGLSSAAFVLRPLVGLAVIGAVFGALYFLYRRKGTAA
jgi:nickel transport protein